MEYAYTSKRAAEGKETGDMEAEAEDVMDGMWPFAMEFWERAKEGHLGSWQGIAQDRKIKRADGEGTRDTRASSPGQSSADS
jgi:hypothetical protein